MGTLRRGRNRVVHRTTDIMSCSIISIILLSILCNPIFFLSASSNLFSFIRMLDVLFNAVRSFGYSSNAFSWHSKASSNFSSLANVAPLPIQALLYLGIFFQAFIIILQCFRIISLIEYLLAFLIEE